MRVSPWVMLVLLVLLMAVTALGAAAAYSGVRQLAIEASELAALPVFDPLGLRPTPTSVGVVSAATPTQLAVPTIVPTLDTAPDTTPDPAQGSPQPGAADVAVAAGGTSADTVQDVPVWSDPSRVTVLLLGIDQRTGEEGPFRTDTMIILSLDPVRQTGVMLSIPRDLWVNIPGFQPGRINTANSLGDAYEYPGGGPALAAATVERNLGIAIDHTVRVNFDLFLTVVDAIGPVEVCINETIHDDRYPDGSYGYMTVHFDPGCQDLNAERLLQYARTRRTEGGDFDRAARQQQVIQALKDQVLSLGGVQSLIGQAAALWEAVRGNVQTTLSLEEIISLALLAQDIPEAAITSAVLDTHYVEPRVTAEGDQVLYLRGTVARLLLQDLFNPVQLSETELRNLARSEGATLSVVNGTATQGLAADTRDWLQAQGFNVVEVGNATRSDYAQTEIKDYTSNPNTARLLALLFGLPITQVVPGNDNATLQDIQIVVGEDTIPLVRGGQ